MMSNPRSDSPVEMDALVPFPIAGAAQQAAEESAMALDASAGLEAVLAAWHAATVRLEQTHKALRLEVMRLTDELERKNRELARKERLADLGQMAAHIAHEIRNTLVPVSLYLSLLERYDKADSEHAHVVGKIRSSFTAVERTVNDLLQFTAEREPDRRAIPLRGLFEELAAAMMPQLVAQRISMMIEAESGVSASADADMLRRALLNLLLNAIDAMPGGGILTLRAEPRDHGIAIEVLDTGPGLSPEAQKRAFDPFFTDKNGGTGLGLAIVDRVAELHGGTAAAENRPEGGARFTLHLPKRSAEVPS